MALKVKDAATAAAKFVQRGSAAGSDYAAGVKNAGQSWQTGAAAAADNYAAGVQEAIGRGAFARGVQQAGASKYETRASTVGARRFPEGIREAGPTWEQSTAPYLQTLAGLTLSPRRPKGDPANFLRVQQVGEALRRRKVGG
jgi:hypothetical protein